MEENGSSATLVFPDAPSENEIENSGLSAQVDYEFDKSTVSSITAFRNCRIFDLQDTDFTDLAIVSDNFDWLVGALLV